MCICSRRFIVVKPIMKIEPNQIPYLTNGYRFQWEKVQDAWVLLYPEGMVKLNPSAGEVLQLVDGLASVENIISTLQNKFPGADTIETDVTEFFDDALTKGWVYFD